MSLSKKNLREMVKEKASKYDYIEYNNIILLSHLDQLFYVYELKQDLLKGKLFQITYDQNGNPSYLLQEGWFKFNFNSSKMIFLLHDHEGIEYQGKSKTIKHQGKFDQGKFQSNFPQQEIPKSIITSKKIIIKDAQTGVILNTKKNNYYQPQPIQQTWCKYNQLISQRDLSILDSNQWITSNILDCYCNYLNIESKNSCSILSDYGKAKFIKMLFVPSTLISSFGNFSQAQNLIKQEFLEFESINYRLDLMYKYVGFIVNKNNFHWQFLYFDLKSTNYYLFDSLGYSLDQRVLNELILFFKTYLNRDIKNYNLDEFSKKQKDGYSCGLYVASYMKYRYLKQREDCKISFKHNEKEIKKTLKLLISK